MNPLSPLSESSFFSPVSAQAPWVTGLFQSLLAFTAEPIFLVGVQTITGEFFFLESNEQARQVLGMKQPGSYPCRIDLAVVETVGSWLMTHLQACWQQQEPLTVGGGPLILDLQPLSATLGLGDLILGSCHHATAPAALQDSAHRLGNLLNGLPGIVFSFANSSHWPMQYLSQGCRELTGYTNTELLYRSGEAFNAITHPQDLGRVLQTIEVAITQKESYEIEYRIITKAGPERWVREYGIPVLDPTAPSCTASVIAVDGFIRDITDWKYINQALDLPLSPVISNIGDDFCRDLALHLTESLRVDFVTIAELTQPHQAETRVVCYQQQVEENFCYDLKGAPCEMVATSREPCFYPCNVQAAFPEDRLLQEMEIEAYVGIPLINARQECLGLMAVMHQSPIENLSLIAAVLQIHAPRVTTELERQRGERALQAAEAKWRALVEYSSDLISILAPSGEIRYHSPAINRLLGYTAAERLGRSFWELIDPADYPFLQQAWQRLITQNSILITVEYRAKHRDGTWRYLESTAQSYIDDPFIAGIVVNTRDVGEHKQTTANLKQLIHFEQLVTTLATQFINLPIEDIDGGLQRILQATGEFTMADRSYLFLLDDASGATISNTHEWCAPGVRPEIQTLQHLVVADLYHFFQPLFDLESICLTHIDQFPADSPTREILERQDIQSLLAVPLSSEGKFIGFLGFDYVHRCHHDLETYIPLLEILSELFINVLGRQQQEKELRQAIVQSAKSEAKYRSIFENTIEGIFQSSPSGSYISANPALAKIYGYSTPAELQENLTDISNQLYVLPERRQEFVEILSQQGYVTDFESQVYRRDGQIIWISENARVVKDAEGQPLYFEGTVVDITERKLAESTIYYQAFHDLLTGLPNRVLFDDRLPLALAEARRHHDFVAVMFLDLDRFKAINDTLGHAIGDQLLQEVAARLTRCLREVDTVARWGGDEFTILLPGLAQPQDAALVAERIITTLKPSFNLEDHHLHITTSLGIAIFPQDGEDADTLLRNADVALYRAKDTGRDNYQFYQATFNAQASFLLQLEQDLRQALPQAQLQLFYQPQVDLVTGEILHLEALARWQHPVHGLLSPGDFILMAEENGLIISIGQWILHHACGECQAWQNIEGLQEVGVSVNLSARQFLDPNLVQTIKAALIESQLPPTLLTVEVTETIAMQNLQRSQEILAELRDLGLGIALDDFGTGYASLNYLKRFPLTSLKIDRSFITDLAEDAQDQAIIRAILSLGQGLNLEIVAEGVETQAQLQILQALGCHGIQGYYCSRPLPYAQLLAWVAAGGCHWPW
ncbi:PAS domain S-box/diguanylate cyclase (GGDEF) domain-containing protein [Synechococcus sp. PCC 6312]|nr:PAS domain S-box/diguanylate cyclase (GGDEF) domain-containing protein [Synechococcus sp. PCC 6312]